MRPLLQNRRAAASSFLLNPTCRRICPRRSCADSSWCLPPHRPPRTVAADALVMVGLGWSPTETTAMLESHGDHRSILKAMAQPDPSTHRLSCRDGRSIRLRAFVAPGSVVEHLRAERSFRRCCELPHSSADSLRSGCRRESWLLVATVTSAVADDKRSKIWRKKILKQRMSMQTFLLLPACVH